VEVSVGLNTVAPATFDNGVNDSAALAGLGITKKNNFAFYGRLSIARIMNSSEFIIDLDFRDLELNL
jgi:hypothetical protein